MCVHAGLAERAHWRLLLLHPLHAVISITDSSSDPGPGDGCIRLLSHGLWLGWQGRPALPCVPVPAAAAASAAAAGAGMGGRGTALACPCVTGGATPVLLACGIAGNACATQGMLVAGLAGGAMPVQSPDAAASTIAAAFAGGTT